MRRRRKVWFIEPGGLPARPMNAWITRWPLLGPITLATILHERGFDAAVYNESISGPVEGNSDAYAEICSADVVGISIMTPTAARGYAIADRLRRDAPNVRIVIGGVHATFMPDEAHAHADVVVRGEGETIIEAVARGEIDGGVVRAEPLADLDRIPTLNHFLVRDFDKLLALCRKRELYELPMMTSRGCPYGCTYCSVTRMFGRRVRRQSVGKVCRDVRRHLEQGFRSLFFYDDNFITDRAWTRDLLERLAPMRVRFNAQARVDFHWADARRQRLDTGVLRALRRGGCNLLFIGYETIDEATARRWHKGYRGGQSLPDRLRQDTRILHDQGIWIHGMFVMGPEHTRRTARGIVDFARRCEIESIQVSVLTPFPGTPLFEEMRPHLLLNDFPADWNYYDAAHCVYDHGRLGLAGLQEAVIDAHKWFYRISSWRSRTLRHLAARPMTFADKVLDLWTGFRTSRNMVREWHSDSQEFIEMNHGPGLRTIAVARP